MKESTDKLTSTLGDLMAGEKETANVLSVKPVPPPVESPALSTANIKPTTSLPTRDGASHSASDFQSSIIRIPYSSGTFTTVIDKQLITIETVASEGGEAVNGVTLSPGSVTKIGDIIISKGPSDIFILPLTSSAPESVGVVVVSVLGQNTVGRSLLSAIYKLRQH
jgi:hypothetical protein